MDAPKKILITGGAGFIGSSLIDQLLKTTDYHVVCLDNLNNYYSPQRKQKNIDPFKNHPNFTFYKADVRDFGALQEIFTKHQFSKIVHLAARAGVRASIKEPLLYEQVNTRGTLHLLELAREFQVPQFIYGSTSAIYGNQKKVPFSESDSCNQPISPYAATKKAAELLCHTYAHLYGINMTVLRFFTVYGPKGRPDMAPYLFTKAVLESKPIEKFGDGTTERDYTYIDDIVAGIMKAMEKLFEYEIINLGNNQPVTLNDFIETLEKATGKKAKIIEKPIPPGDVDRTCADIEKAKKLLDWRPTTSIEIGLKKFVEWYRQEV